MNQAKLNPCSSEELSIRKSFKGDYKLSCGVLDDNDIFNKSIRIQHLEEAWSDYLGMANRVGFEKLNEYRRKMRNQLVGYIQEVKNFDKLVPVEAKYPYKGEKNYLRDENVGHRIFSIDLVKGNYQALKSLGSQYVLDSESYEDLVERFTKERSLINSKYFRQMVFGLLKPDVQGSVQRNMMGYMISKVYDKLGELPIVHLSNDEVMFRIGKDLELTQLEKALNGVKYQYRLSEFRLEKIHNSRNEPWFVRYYVDDIPPRLMGIHTRYFNQVSNFIEGTPNIEKDFWWREQGRLSKLMDAEKFGAPVE